MGNIADIITAAASSPLGIVSLAMILLSSVALRMFPPSTTSAPIRILVFAMLGVGVVLLALAVLQAARSERGQPQNGAQTQASPPVSGYAYYEEKNGELTREGRFRLLRSGPVGFDALREGDVLRAADGANLREHPIPDTRVLDEIQTGECVRVRAKARRVPVTDATSGGWVAAETTACPHR